MANNERKVGLKVQGVDGFSGTFDKLSKAQQKILDQNRKIAQSPPGDLRKFYQETQKAIEATEQSIIGLRQRFVELSSAEGDNRAAIAQLVVEKAKLQVKAGELRNSLDGVRQASHQLKATQQGGFSAFNATATAMEREAAAASKLAAARSAANQRLAGMINDRLNAPAKSNFAAHLPREDAAVALSNTRAAQAEAAAMAKAAAEAQRKVEIQQRLNTTAQTGFAHWSRYADTVARIATDEARENAIAERKAAIRARLNATAESGFRAWSRSADGLRAEGAAANQTATALKKVETASRQAARAQDTLADSAAGVTGGKRKRGDSGGRKGEDQDVELYGLKPYQMVNLGYQINDVISGLAMGQAPVQILAQQAGQLAQIWPQAMVGLVRSAPQIALLAAAFSPLIAAVVRVKTEANTLRQFQQSLAFLADGSRYSAAELAKLTVELDRAGVKLDDARKGVMALVKDGFSETQIRAITDMARNLAKFTGNSFADEVTRLGTAFSGNAETVRDLDKDLQFLTAAQLEQIYAMDRAGNKAGAMKIAQDALNASLAASRKEMTPWEQSVKNMADAWNSLIDTLADTDLIKDFIRDLGGLARDFEMITRGINSATDWLRRAKSPTDEEKYQANLAERARITADLAPYQGTSDEFYRMQAAELEEQLSAVNAEIAEYEAGLKRSAAITAATTATAGALVTKSEEQKKLGVEMQLALDARLAAMAQEAALATATQREQFIQKEILDQQNEARKKGLDLTKEQLEAIQKGAGALFDAQTSLLATGNYGSLVDRIVGVESGGRADAKNPNSSATGLGQFIESTWLNLFRKYFPEQAQRMGEDAILELRKDAALSRQMVEIYARENAKVLQTAGVSVNDAAVYLAHFLGPQGAINVLKAAPNTPTSAVLGADQIAANRSILEGKTTGDTIAWAQRKVGLTDQQVAGQQRLNQLHDDEAKKQQDYITGYQQRLADQKFELQMASQSAREAAIQEALRNEELKAREAGLQLTKEQRAEIEATTGALFDQQNAMAQVDALMERRSQLAESLQIAQDAGDRGKVEQIVEQIRLTEDELTKAIDTAIAFYQALGGPSADQAILKLQNLKAAAGDAVKDLQTQFLPVAEDLNEQLSDIGADAFGAFAEAAAKGENALDALWESARQGIAQFLIDIGKAIVKQAMFNAISGGTSGGGAGGAISQWVGSLFGARHSGGLAGSAAPTRMVNPAVFANAQRFHSGGVLGLGPNEVPIIGLKDEEMLTRDDPRHVLNGGKQQSAANVKVVNALSGAEVLQHALADEVGQKTIINWMTRNRTAISAALGS